MDVLSIDDIGQLSRSRGLFRRARPAMARKIRVRKGKIVEEVAMEQATEVGVDVIKSLNLTPTPVIITAVAKETVKQVPVRRRVRPWWKPWAWFRR